VLEALPLLPLLLQPASSPSMRAEVTTTRRIELVPFRTGQDRMDGPPPFQHAIHDSGGETCGG